MLSSMHTSRLAPSRLGRPRQRSGEVPNREGVGIQLETRRPCGSIQRICAQIRASPCGRVHCCVGHLATCRESRCWCGRRCLVFGYAPYATCPGAPARGDRGPSPDCVLSASCGVGDEGGASGLLAIDCTDTVKEAYKTGSGSVPLQPPAAWRDHPLRTDAGPDARPNDRAWPALNPLAFLGWHHVGRLRLLDRIPDESHGGIHRRHHVGHACTCRENLPYPAEKPLVVSHMTPSAWATAAPLRATIRCRDIALIGLVGRRLHRDRAGLREATAMAVSPRAS